MDPKNLHASLLVFDAREPVEVRSALAKALNCTFDEQFAKADESGTTWFCEALGFEIAFQLMSRRDDGAWYVLTLAPSPFVIAQDAPMETIDFHLSQVLRAGGFATIATTREYREKYHQPSR